jgi:hypothetical protein
LGRAWRAIVYRRAFRPADRENNEALTPDVSSPHASVGELIKSVAVFH